MDKLAMMIEERRHEIENALNKIETGSKQDRTQAMLLLDSLLAGIAPLEMIGSASLDMQIQDVGSTETGEELKQLIEVVKRAKSVRKRLKDMEYQRKKIKQIKISLNKDTDADIIEILDSKDNVQGYIKDVIRKDNEE